MKPFVKIILLVFVVAAASGLFLKNATQNKNRQPLENNKQTLQSTNDTIIFSDEYIGWGDEALHKILHINMQEDQGCINFYTDVNSYYSLLRYPANKCIISWNGTFDNNFCCGFENDSDSAFSATTESCNFISDIQDTTILEHNITNDCIDDTINIKSNFLNDTIQNIFMHGY